VSCQILIFLGWWDVSFERGGAEVVDYGLSGDGCQAPVQLVERALFGPEFWIGSSVLSELVALERERLDPVNSWTSSLRLPRGSN